MVRTLCIQYQSIIIIFELQDWSNFLALEMQVGEAIMDYVAQSVPFVIATLVIQVITYFADDTKVVWDPLMSDNSSHDQPTRKTYL